MPLGERACLALKIVNSENLPVDLLALKWPAGGGDWYLALPLRVCPTGIILALPKNALSEEELDAGMEAAADALVGPNHVVRVSLGDSEVAEVEVVMVEFSIEIRQQMELRTARSRRVLKGFADNIRELPNLTELNDQVVSWLETGAVRVEEYMTALEVEEETGGLSDKLLQEFQNLQTMMDRRLRVMEGQIHELQTKPAHPLGAMPKQPGGGWPQKSGVREDVMEDAINAARSVVPKRPPKLADEPGKAADTAIDMPGLEDLDVGAGGSSASMDDLMKLHMLKMLKEMQQPKGKSKSKKLPGLTSWEDSDSSQEDGATWSSNSKGGRGIEAVERVRHAMKFHPEAYQERMELKAVDATELVPTIPLQFVKGSPVGKSRTAGYCLQGFAEVHRLLLENKPKQARLHVLRMIAALEQFLIDESWVVASRLMCTEEPPWGHWATQDVAAIRRQLVYNRLSESTWMAALINQLKEEEWLTKKRANLQQPKGNSKGKVRDKDKEKDAEA